MKGFHPLGNSTLVSISYDIAGWIAVEMERPGAYEIELRPERKTELGDLKGELKRIAYQLLEDIERIEGL